MCQKSHSKTCSKCAKDQPLSEYHVYKSGPRKGKIWSSCKTCRRSDLYRWRQANPEKYQKLYYKARIKMKYGLTPDEVIKHGVCPICEKDKRLVIDHCHSDGHVRGFICHNCNTLLGHIENKSKMSKIKSYLLGEITNYVPEVKRQT